MHSMLTKVVTVTQASPEGFMNYHILPYQSQCEVAISITPILERSKSKRFQKARKSHSK